MILGLVLAGGLLVALGIVDDKRGMSATTKLAGQIAAAAILVVNHTQLSWLPEPGGRTFYPSPNEATLLTVLVVVATINAVNFIDGLDGLAAGIAAIAAVSMLIYYYSLTGVLGGQSALAAPLLASAILTGICLGFLPHNFHPARIFMGDTGAMLLGLVLAYAPIASIASVAPQLLTYRVNRYPEIMPLLLPAALMVIPYADLLLAVVRRTRAGLSPFAADRKHLHHRLLDIGHSQRASVLVMYLWAAVFSGSIVWFSLQKTSAHHHGSPVLVFVLITAGAVLALVLMSMPRLRKLDRSARRRAVAAASAPAPQASAALTPVAAALTPAALTPAALTPAPAALTTGSIPPAPALAAVPAAATGRTAAEASRVAELDHDLFSVNGLSQLGAPGSVGRPRGAIPNGASGASVGPAGGTGASAGSKGVSPGRAQPVRSVIGSVPPAVAGDPLRMPRGAEVQDDDPSGPASGATSPLPPADGHFRPADGRSRPAHGRNRPADGRNRPADPAG